MKKGEQNMNNLTIGTKFSFIGDIYEVLEIDEENKMVKVGVTSYDELFGEEFGTFWMKRSKFSEMRVMAHKNN